MGRNLNLVGHGPGPAASRIRVDDARGLGRHGQRPMAADHTGPMHHEGLEMVKNNRKKAAAKIPPQPQPRGDKQADDEYCTCCEELCDCGDCQECTADTAHVVPVKERWAKARRPHR